MRAVPPPEISLAVRQLFDRIPPAALAALMKWLEAPSESLAADPLQTIAKPYGRNHILEIVGDFGISCACFDVGAETSLHRHTRRTEFYCVRTGCLELVSIDSTTTLRRHHFASSRPGDVHRLRNAGPTVLEVLEVFSPALLDDKIRIEDRYERRLGAVTRDE